jgi:hypothetical protein
MTGVGEVLVSPIIETTNIVVNGTLAGTQKLGRWRRRLVGISARSLGFGAPSRQRSLLGGGGRTKLNEVITTTVLVMHKCTIVCNPFHSALKPPSLNARYTEGAAVETEKSTKLGKK